MYVRMYVRIYVRIYIYIYIYIQGDSFGTRPKKMQITGAFCWLYYRNVCMYVYVYIYIYRVILSVLYPRKCEYLKDYSLDFEHAYMTTYLAS